jgi:hypothetical protein
MEVVSGLIRPPPPGAAPDDRTCPTLGGRRKGLEVNSKPPWELRGEVSPKDQSLPADLNEVPELLLAGPSGDPASHGADDALTAEAAGRAD